MNPPSRGPAASAAEASDLLRLVYVSVAAPALGPADLEAIAAASRRNNAARGLTGLLLFGGARFYSVLEGPERRVLARMERIITDPRHRRLRILREDPIPARRFANWAFGCMPDDAGAPGEIEALDRFLLGIVGRL